jgi:hypothetical protein
MWTGKTPSLSFLKIWGCEVYVKKHESDKLTPKSNKFIFVGYPKETLGYYFYNWSDGKVFVAQNGVFLERVQDDPLGKDFTSDANAAEQVEMPVAREAPPQPRRSERAHRATDKLNLMITGERDILLLDNDEPMTYEEAMIVPGSEKWQSAMRSEIDSMGDNQV